MSLTAKDKQLFERLEKTSYNNQAKVFINAYWEKGIQPKCEEVRNEGKERNKRREEKGKEKGGKKKAKREQPWRKVFSPNTERPYTPSLFLLPLPFLH